MEIEEKFASDAVDKIKAMVVNDEQVGKRLPDGSERLKSNTFRVVCTAPHAFKQGEYIETFLEKMCIYRVGRFLTERLRVYGITTSCAVPSIQYYGDDDKLFSTFPEFDESSFDAEHCCDDCFTCGIYSAISKPRLFEKQRKLKEMRRQQRIKSNSASYATNLTLIVLDPRKNRDRDSVGKTVEPKRCLSLKDSFTGSSSSMFSHE